MDTFCSVCVHVCVHVRVSIINHMHYYPLLPVRHLQKAKPVQGAKHTI